MKTTRITLAGWHAYPLPITLDLATLPGTLTAVSGPNGAGKTTLCALAVLGAFYRDAGRQACNALAAARDAFVEVDAQVGRDVLTIRQVFDGQRGGGSALVMAGGVPIDACRSGGIREYRAWAATALPPQDVVQAGQFLAQGDGGLLTASDAERASVILRALGADRLERLAEATRKRAAAAGEALAVTVARLADEEARAGDVAAVGGAVVAAKTAAEQAHAAVVVAAGVVEAARAAAVAQGALAAAEGRLGALQAQHGDAVAAAADAPTAREAVEAAARLDAAIGEARAAWDAAERDRAAAWDEATRWHRTAEAATGRLAQAEARHQAAREALAGQRAAAEARLAETGVRLANNRALLADAGAIRRAVGRLAAIDAEAGRHRADAAGAAAAEAAAVEAEREACRAGDVAAGQAEAAGRRVAGLRERLAGREAVLAAVAALPEAQAAAGEAAEAVRTGEARLAALRAEAAGGWERRHGGLRGAIVTICEGV